MDGKDLPSEEPVLVPDCLGIEAIDRACRNVYPHDPPVLIRTPKKKFWSGGQMPLDYLKVFFNPGNDGNIPPHWHFVTYGFSDLYGDDRLHNYTGRGEESGYGFELTLRLKVDDSSDPPSWPWHLFDIMGNYVFETGTRFQEFDQIPGQDSIDRVNDKTSRDFTGNPPSGIKHLILVEDPQICNLDSPHGTVQFLQIVGIMEAEFWYARAWSTCGIIDCLLEHPGVGPLMITDMARKHSIFDLNPDLVGELSSKIDAEGSSLTKVTAHVQWKNLFKSPSGTVTDTASNDLDIPVRDDEEETGAMFQILESVYIQLDPVSAELLPLVVRGRLQHGKMFAFSSRVDHPQQQTIHFIPYDTDVSAQVFVDQDTPLKACGGYVQIYCDRNLIEQMETEFQKLDNFCKCWTGDTVEEFHFEKPQMTVAIHPSSLKK